jgi:AcrR family transcriptional regulator
MLVESGTRRRTQVERSTATQEALIRAARILFASGYHATPAEDVVRLAGVTSGALYHHFGDKHGLFRAAFDSVERSLADRVRHAAVSGKSPWQRLEDGVGEYLRACSEEEVRQIVLVDGPSVLGWEEWREADAAHHLRPLAAALARTMRAGLIERRPALPLARVLLGALTEAGLAATEERDEMFWLLRQLRVSR